MEAIRRSLSNSRVVGHLRSPEFQKYFQNVSWLLFEKIFTLFVALVVNIYVARYLEPDRFGLLNYAISFVGIFSAFTTLGLDQILVRELARNPDRSASILGTGFMLKLSGSLLLMAVMVVILPAVHNTDLTNALIVIIASAELLKGFDVINNYYQARVESRYTVQVQLFVNIFSNALKMGLVFFQAPLVYF